MAEPKKKRKQDRVVTELQLPDFKSQGLLGDYEDPEPTFLQKMGEYRPLQDGQMADPDFGTSNANPNPTEMDQMRNFAEYTKNAAQPMMQNMMDQGRGMMQQGAGMAQQGGDALTQMLQAAQQKMAPEANAIADRFATRYGNPLGITNRDPRYLDHPGNMIENVSDAWNDVKAGQNTAKIKQDALEKYRELKKKIREAQQ